MGTHSGQAAELAQVLALLEARAHDPARPLALALESLEGLADLLRRIVWTDEASAAGGAQSELSALLAGPLGATVNDARLRAGLRLIELLGHLTAEPALRLFNEPSSCRPRLVRPIRHGLESAVRPDHLLTASGVDRAAWAWQACCERPRTCYHACAERVRARLTTPLWGSSGTLCVSLAMWLTATPKSRPWSVPRS